MRFQSLEAPPAFLTALLSKRIPVAAGLGGGSSDAAAAIDAALAAWDVTLPAQNVGQPGRFPRIGRAVLPGRLRSRCDRTGRVRGAASGDGGAAGDPAGDPARARCHRRGLPGVRRRQSAADEPRTPPCPRPWPSNFGTIPRRMSCSIEPRSWRSPTTSCPRPRRRRRVSPSSPRRWHASSSGRSASPARARRCGRSTRTSTRQRAARGLKQATATGLLPALGNGEPFVAATLIASAGRRGEASHAGEDTDRPRSSSQWIRRRITRAPTRSRTARVQCAWAGNTGSDPGTIAA